MIHILIAIVLAAPPLELVDQLRSDTGGIVIAIETAIETVIAIVIAIETAIVITIVIAIAIVIAIYFFFKK